MEKSKNVGDEFAEQRFGQVLGYSFGQVFGRRISRNPSKKSFRSFSKSFAGNMEQPGWTAPAEYEYVTSMTAVVKVNLAGLYPETASDWQLTENDRLAAFAGDVCCGVAAPEDGLFYLFVCGVNNLSAGGNVKLRYYSAHYKNVFAADDAFEFKNDAHIGSVSEPFVPVLVVEK